MTFVEFLKDAKKALAVAGTVESGAVALGLLDNAQAGYVTAGLGALSTVLVYALRNVPPSQPKHAAPEPVAAPKHAASDDRPAFDGGPYMGAPSLPVAPAEPDPVATLPTLTPEPAGLDEPVGEPAASDAPATPSATA